MTAGVIGIGAMGLGVAASLRRAGIPTFVRDIRPDAERAAAALGATVVSSPAAVARRAAVIVILVVDAAQVDDVLFGPDGVAATADERPVVVLSSTVDPDYVVRTAQRLASQGIALVDAPVSGGPARAHAGSLSVMVGAEPGPRLRCAAVLDAMASRVFDVGAIGDGARMKLCNNLLAGVNLAAAAEALALAVRSGLDPAVAAEVIGASSGGSWIVSDRLPRALQGDLVPPRAATRILAKDVALAAAFARRCGVATPLTDRAREAFEGAVERGHGEDDDAVLLALALRHAASKKG